MKLGFFTACLPAQPFENIVDWAADQGFKALEIACWPMDNTRDFSATTIDVDALDAAKADKIKKYLDSKGIVISSLGYYDNNLHSDPKVRVAYLKHLYKVVDAAQLLDVKLVGTFIGRNTKLSVADNFKEVKEQFSEIVAYAEKKGRRIMIENCPMVGWQEPGIPGNLAYSPQLWDKLFALIPSASFGLNFDPSHLVWLGIDYLKAIKDYHAKIFHVHAKDAQVLPDNLYRFGIFGNILDEGGHLGESFWKPRISGHGDVNWEALMATLYDVNLGDRVVSIEHEDPVWAGTEEKIKAGLVLAKRRLLQLII